MTEPELTPTKSSTEGLSSLEPALSGDAGLSEAAAAEIYGEEKGTALALRAPPGASKLVTLLWMLPGALWLVIFLIAPVIVVLVVSFFTGTITGFKEVFTTSNYSAIFSSSSQYLSTLAGVARNSASRLRTSPVRTSTEGRLRRGSVVTRRGSPAAPRAAAPAASQPGS